MALLDFFISRKRNTANIAKQRLQIIVAEQRKNNLKLNHLKQLKHEIYQVICKYMKVESNMISVHLDQKVNNITVLELNIQIPE